MDMSSSKKSPYIMTFIMSQHAGKLTPRLTLISNPGVTLHNKPSLTLQNKLNLTLLWFMLGTTRLEQYVEKWI